MYSNFLLGLLLSIVPIGITQLLECPSTSFEHSYRVHEANGSVHLISYNNYFPMTRINEYAMMKDLCVDRSGFPVVRRCLANQQWEDLSNVTCELDKESKRISQSLNNIQFELIEGIFNRFAMHYFTLSFMKNVSKIIGQDINDIRPVDVINVNKIINEVARQPKDVTLCTELIGLLNNLMATNKTVLRISARLNATNELLFNFEDYLNALALQLAPADANAKQFKAIPLSNDLVDVKLHNGIQVLIGGNLSVFYLYPECTSYTGIAIYTQPAAGREGCKHHRFWYRFLHANQSLEELKAEPDLQTATYLTPQLWRALRSIRVSYLVFKIYANGALFVDTTTSNNQATPASHVLSINIPQARKYLPYPLVLLLRNEANYSNPLEAYCGYWNYSTWSSKGLTTDRSSLASNSIVACYTQHLTQFAFLVGASCRQFNCSGDKDQESIERDESTLDAITAVGCGLSILGLLGIWLTAAVSRIWRSKPSNKLLLNMCLAMTLLFGLMLLLYINEWFWRYSFERHSFGCRAVGALFQYSVLLLFTWMLLIGILQYQRHVLVFAYRSEHALLICAAIAWTLPLLPTLLLLFLSPEAYTAVKSGDISSVCYPSGSGLVYGVLLPIGLVLNVNVFIFVCISYNVSRLEDRNGTMIWLQIRLFVLLFFLLGLSWIFGICSYFQLGFWLTVLFCVSATIQGFVLFVYFVLFDKVARTAWIRFVCGHKQTVSFELN